MNAKAEEVDGTGAAPPGQVKGKEFVSRVRIDGPLDAPGHFTGPAAREGSDEKLPSMTFSLR